MIDKEVSELRRRFRQEHHNITKLRGCYVNARGEIVATFCESLTMLPVEEQEKYLELLKKALSGSIGKTLVDIVFSTKQVMDSDEHRLLMRLRDSRLTDEEAAKTLFEEIAATLHLADNYLILLATEAYDVPFKSSDGVMQDDAGDTQFSYIVCSICPVKETKPVLQYDSAEGLFHNHGTEWVVRNPELGFLFPAFDSRASNIYGALYYTRSADASYDEFVSTVFHTKPPMAVTTQKETFREVLTDSLEEECSVEVVQNVRGKLREMVQIHKEARIAEPLSVTQQEVGSVLQDCGISEEHMAAFRVKYDEAFGVDTALPPQNLMNGKQLEYRTPDVVIKVNPEREDLVETRVLGGAKYLLIKADEGVELNGINIAWEE